MATEEMNQGGSCHLEDKKMLTQELMDVLKRFQSIEEFAKEYRDCFVTTSVKEHLEHLLKQKGFKKSEIIQASQINGTYGYQIFSGLKRPSRDKLLAIAVAMGLTLEECQTLLKIGDLQGLYIKNRRDAALIFGIQKGLSVIEINEILFDLGEFIL